MWPFKKNKENPRLLAKEIDGLSKSLHEKIAVEEHTTDDSTSADVAQFLNSLGHDSDVLAFQTLQANFTRAVERYKYDDVKLLSILKDWRDSLNIFNIVQDGNEDKFPQIILKTGEIERRLKSSLGNDYIPYAKVDDIIKSTHLGL